MALSANLRDASSAARRASTLASQACAAVRSAGGNDFNSRSVNARSLCTAADVTRATMLPRSVPVPSVRSMRISLEAPACRRSTSPALAAAASPEQMQADPTIAGKVPPGTVLKLFDASGEEVPTGQTGRIFLHNETALKGYTNPKTEVVEIDGLVEIGDLGYMDERGFLHVQSRNDDMIIVGGENVHPQSVTEVLEEMPGIGEVYAHGVDDEEMFKRIAVWVVPEEDEHGRGLDADSVRDWVRARLADHSIPRDVHFMDELPRNPIGKVVPRLLPGI